MRLSIRFENPNTTVNLSNCKLNILNGINLSIENDVVEFFYGFPFYTPKNIRAKKAVYNLDTNNIIIDIINPVLALIAIVQPRTTDINIMPDIYDKIIRLKYLYSILNI